MADIPGPLFRWLSWRLDLFDCLLARAADRDAPADVPEVDFCPCGVSVEDCCVSVDRGECPLERRLIHGG